MNYLLLTSLIVVSSITYSQDGCFQGLLEMYDGNQNPIDSTKANMFFGFTANEDCREIFTDQILIQKPNFIGLSSYMPCRAGGICETSVLKIFDYEGNEIDEIRPFEFHFADCSFSNKSNCTVISDTLLILAFEEEKGDCSEDTIFSRETSITYFHISRTGRIRSGHKKRIDTRREHYYTSCYELSDYQTSKMSKEDLAIMRNEIFAIYGYKFKSEKWKKYFSQKDWYKPRYDDVDHLLNPIEKINIRIIQELEEG